ncbi:MAG: hypothetical protein RL685_2251 [Pseudomonadota bacterium]|jgi:Tol biopolymer transport system component
MAKHWYSLAPSRSTSFRSGALAAAVALLCACPQLLDDDFSLHGIGLDDAVGNVPNGGSSGGDDAAGNQAAGGNASGGAPGVGGAAGASSVGGSSGAAAAGAAGTAGASGIDLSGCAFGEPQLLTGLGLSGSMWGPSLSADGLTLYFSSDAAGSEDLYQATRSARGTTFAAAVPLDGLNTGAGEGSPYVTADGLTLYFYSSRSGGVGSRDLYTATRTSSSAELGNVQLLSNVNAGNYDHLPRLSADELTLLFTSARGGSPGAASLWTATRSSTAGSFGSPSLLPGVNDDALNEAGGLSTDGLTLYFDSTRAGLGAHDLWLATRANVGAAFGNLAPLGTLSTADDEYNLSLSRDELELVFTSNRNGSATYRLYRSLRSCP